jgi:acetyl esterase/lipase
MVFESMRSWKTITTGLLAFSGLFLSCGDSNKTTYASDAAFKIENISYGLEKLNTLDLYLSKNRNENTPFVILIHGGAWAHGDKSQFYSEFAAQLFSYGWCVANMNYRLISEETNYTHMLDDIKNVIGFLKSNREKFHLSAHKLHLIGYSAGGHLALLYGHKEDETNEIASVVSLCGPTNLNDPSFQHYVDSAWNAEYIYPLLLGEEFIYNSKSAVNASPVHHVKNKPSFLVHGTFDDIVPYSQALQMRDSLKAKQVDHFFISMQEGGHNIDVRYADSVDAAIKNWVEVH